MEYSVFNWDKKEIEKIDLDESVFGMEFDKGLMHIMANAHLANLRISRAATKSRSDVASSNKKPFKQKGTGRARQGHKRVPHFVGGGTAFGPNGRQFGKKVNRRVKERALAVILSEHVRNKSLFILEDMDPGSMKTKELNKKLSAFEAKKSLIINDSSVPFELDEKTGKRINHNNLYFAARNLEAAKVVSKNQINTYDLMNHTAVFISKSHLLEVVKRLAK